ncbi:hypothetical protein G6F32_016142 [Rhizopus arrhizus]|nr:hypothetical protein G6F32_016142 [Rhizopus arrhizus]
MQASPGGFGGGLPGLPASGGARRGTTEVVPSLTGALPPVFSATPPVPAPCDFPSGAPKRTCDIDASPLLAWRPNNQFEPSTEQPWASEGM